MDGEFHPVDVANQVVLPLPRKQGLVLDVVCLNAASLAGAPFLWYNPLEEVVLNFWPPAFGFVLSTLIAWGGYQKRSLSRSGVAGAIILGTLIFGLGGWVWGLTLITFFISSSALSHYKTATKAHLAEKFAKGHRRDLGQTLANGGAGALMAIAYALWSEPVFFAAYLGAMATVNADTWATELGVLNPTPPRLITTGRVVEVGASGGVSRLGTLATAAGALTIGLVALFFDLVGVLVSGGDDPSHGDTGTVWRYGWGVLAALGGGLVGSLFATTRSRNPSSLKSPATRATGSCPTSISPALTSPASVIGPIVSKAPTALSRSLTDRRNVALCITRSSDWVMASQRNVWVVPGRGTTRQIPAMATAAT